MKKLICTIISLCILATSIFAASFKAQVKGEVFVKTETGEMIPLEAEDSISDEDVIIIIEEKASITFTVGESRMVIRKPGTYKVADLIKRVS